jgi:hypothetical protein
MPKENPTTGTAWSGKAQIECDSLTHFEWQRQLCQASAFATDIDEAVVPIEIIQVQRNNLAGPQA